MLNLSHKSLMVYKYALELTKEIYTLTGHLPKEEMFGLSSQLKRAAVSVCSNLAEGAGRISKAEKKRFYEISRSSLIEIDTQISICLMVNYLDKSQIQKLELLINNGFAILSKMISNLS